MTTRLVVTLDQIRIKECLAFYVEQFSVPYLFLTNVCVGSLYVSSGQKEIPVEQKLRSSHDITVFRSFVLEDTNFHDRVSSMLKSLHNFISII